MLTFKINVWTLNLFDINNIFTTIFGNPLSYIEFFATFFGLFSVWLATRQVLWTWFTGLINIILSFKIFFQVQLYSDMFLQVFFFITNIYGWVVWRNQLQENKPVTILPSKTRIILLVLTITGTFVFGSLIKNIHLLLPAVFVHPASFPLIDTFVAIASITGTILLARRIIDSWVIFLIVDLICVFVYALKQIMFISFEYGVFCILACMGLFSWLQSIGNSKKIITTSEK